MSATTLVTRPLNPAAPPFHAKSRCIPLHQNHNQQQQQQVQLINIIDTTAYCHITIPNHYFYNFTFSNPPQMQQQLKPPCYVQLQLLPSAHHQAPALGFASAARKGYKAVKIKSFVSKDTKPAIRGRACQPAGTAPRLRFTLRKPSSKISAPNSNITASFCWEPKTTPTPSSSASGNLTNVTSGCCSIPKLTTPAPVNTDSVQLRLAGNTTVMIKNVPNQISRDGLMGFLDEICTLKNQESPAVPCAYDFLYIPIDFKTGCNRGYAFVNFTSAQGAVKVCGWMQNQTWHTNPTSKKICDVKVAKIQGKEALVSHFRKVGFPCQNKDYLPVALHPPHDGCADSASVISIVGMVVGLRRK